MAGKAEGGAGRGQESTGVEGRSHRPGTLTGLVPHREGPGTPGSRSSLPCLGSGAAKQEPYQKQETPFVSRSSIRAFKTRPHQIPIQTDSPLSHLSWHLSFTHGREGLWVHLGATPLLTKGLTPRARAWQGAGNGGLHAVRCPFTVPSVKIHVSCYE